MAKSLYTAQAHVTGGRENGHGVTSDGAWTCSSAPLSKWAAKEEARTLSSFSPSATPHASKERSASSAVESGWNSGTSPSNPRSA